MTARAVKQSDAEWLLDESTIRDLFDRTFPGAPESVYVAFKRGWLRGRELGPVSSELATQVRPYLAVGGAA